MRKKLATSNAATPPASPASSHLMGFTVALTLFAGLMTVLYLTT